MNLLRPALRRPLTIVVAVIAVAFGSVLALRQVGGKTSNTLDHAEENLVH